MLLYSYLNSPSQRQNALSWTRKGQNLKIAQTLLSLEAFWEIFCCSVEAFGAVDHLTPCSHLLSPASTPFSHQSIASPFIALDFSAPAQRAWIARLWNAQLPACPELHEVGLDPLYCCLHAQKEGFLYFCLFNLKFCSFLSYEVRWKSLYPAAC